jgi:DNA-binding LacI/PurR family transcriptional regulator
MAKETSLRNGKKSLRDVARAAGVSIATVSRVARGNASVDPELKKRVREAAAKLGFVLEHTSRTRALAFVLSNRDMLHPFHSHILVGAEAQCSARAWDMIFLAFRYDLHSPWKRLHLPRVLQRGDVVRAVILSGTNSQNLLELLTHKSIPFVVLGNNVVGEWRSLDYDAVYSDDVQGAREMTLYLQTLGHRAIWFVGNCRLPWFARAFEGYRAAMEEAGLRPRLSEIESEDANEVGYLAAKSRPGRGGNRHFCRHRRHGPGSLQGVTGLRTAHPGRRERCWLQ